MVDRLGIEAFLVLAEELHFGRTAERLHVTTGRISQTIQKLERNIGAPLFERTSRKVQLTPLGTRLYGRLRPAYDGIVAGLAEARAFARGACGALRVGFVSSATGQLAIRAAVLFEERYPGWEVEPKEVTPTDCLKVLRDRDIDILLVSLPHEEPDMVTGPVLFAESRVLAVAAAHPYAGRASVTMDDLAGIDLLRMTPTGNFPNGWRADRGERDTGAQFDTLAEALGLIGANRGAYVFGQQVVCFHSRPDVRYLPILDAPPVEWAPTWLTERDTDVIRGFVDAAREVPFRDTAQCQPILEPS
ncbi:LysR family transcriptional regulator [Nocardia sp. CDC153]|uniref:LysR family transcriptional regulator n=1 Tax=Nocardia sp. CDC153 TaxID=3112167 RepID=UPI002DB85BF1|nr:LysR family transcriptional regulator [Nocardia sp. CDC153]MEC3952629.1 LysR family transcriptional regulator [Nocardia sp. CDC153]